MHVVQDARQCRTSSEYPKLLHIAVASDIFILRIS